MGFGAQVHLPALLLNKNIEISAIADSGSGSAQQIANTYGLDISVYKSGEDLLKDNKIDMVTIATPAKAQSMLIKEAIRQGKHVICEKPFGSNLNQIVEIIERGSAKNVLVIPAYSFRYDSGIRYLIKLIQEGVVGEVVGIDINWLTSGGLDEKKIWTWRDDVTAGGGVLIDWCCHVIDYCSLISKSDVQEVEAKTTICVKSRIDKKGILKKVTAPDSCELDLIYMNGIKAQISISKASSKATGHFINIKGSEGSIVFKHTPPFTDKSYFMKLNKKNKNKIYDFLGEKNVAFKDQRSLSFSRLVTEFIDKIDNKNIKNSLPDLDSAKKVWSVLAAAENSVKSDKKVFVNYQ